MKKLLAVTLGALFASLLTTNVDAQNNFTLNPLTSFYTRGDGSIQPLDFPFVTTGSNERGLAYDPVTSNLVFVAAGGGGAGSTTPGTIYILDGTYGTNITTLDTTGMSNGTYVSYSAAVAEDGVVYVFNHVNVSTTNPIICYRWDSTTSTNPPLVVFSNTIAPSQRWVSSLDIRGAGTNTQIIVGSQVQSGSSGTNVMIFTTIDGTNFTATVLATDVTTGSGNSGGITFGAGDTFWWKLFGSSLRRMSFNLTTSNAVTFASYGTDTVPSVDNFTVISVDVTNNLLAVIELAGGVIAASGGADRIRLYDISDTNRAPSFLASSSYTPNNANTTTPVGYLDFGGGRLYTHVINNGLVAYSVDSITTPAPIILSQPPATNRIASGASITLSVSAYPLVSYQWQSNGVAIAGATNSTLTLVNASTNFAALYTVTVTNFGGSTNLDSQLLVVNPADLFHLSLLWRVSVTDGKPYINLTGGSGNTPSTRWMAYNTLSNHLLMPIRSSSTTSNYDVWVVNATNGAALYKLNTNGIVLGIGQGGIGLTAIGAADDGAIYASCEAVNSAGDAGADPSKFYRVYRWANDDSNTVPVQIFQGDPSYQSTALRWGDTMAVRGSGTNTQIIVDCNSREASNTKRKVAILTPTDQYLTNFSSVWIQGDNIPSTGQNPGAIGKSLEFDFGSAGYWQKHKSGYLVRNSFDTNTPGDFGFPNIAYSIVTIYSNNFGNGIYGLGVNSALNLAAGVSTNGTLTVADKLNLYDISTPGAPLLLAQYSFPTTPANANGNFISHTFFASNSVYGSIVFSLDGNNGIMAFQVKSGPLEPPSFTTQPQNLRLLEGGSGSMSAATLEPADLQWQKNGGSGFTNVVDQTNASFIITNAQLADAASYRVIATNVISGAGTSSVAIATVTLIRDTFQLSQVWGKVIGSETYLTVGANATPFQRSLGFSTKANQLFVINRTSSSGGLSVNVLDPDTGTKLYELNTNGISLPAFTPYSTDSLILVSLGVADDGAIYAGNVSMANNTTTNAIFRLWRWADSDSNTLPQLVYEGEPANSALSLRWGDVMHVRGSGVNTEIILDCQRSAILSGASVLTPVNSSMTAFTNKPFLHSYGTVTIGRSIQFGLANTVWQKSYGGAFTLSSYNLIAQNSSILTNISGVYPSTLGGLFIHPKYSLAVGVNFNGVANTSPDKLNLYEISIPGAPLLLGTYDFPTNHVANDNHITHAVYGAGKVFALNANNGIVALELIGPELAIQSDGTDVILSWFTNQYDYTLQRAPLLTNTSPGYWANEGSAPANIGTKYFVTNNVSSTGTNQFYRLKSATRP